MLRLISRNFSAKANLLSITSQATSKLKELMEKQPKDVIGLKIGVKKRGCNGMSYTMEYAKQKNKLDEMVEIDGIKVIIDARAVMFILGTTMDYINTTTREEFTFENPNAKSKCGCGESFNV
ncbi:unnamed protein product [Blepharisma stoltei]|uniref:Core domain-containing protein n=1 Tax=Blepharisma stoltei TaxID=1481888 RepID=A0AAU9ILR4_9CILI|nr:unnamed protein product [Blepharisma stoltei]